MPYITQKEKELITLHVDITTPGQLNYAFTQLISKYLKTKGLNYQHINDAIGALESAKLELYRRVVVPYEEEKMKLNGDVY